MVQRIIIIEEVPLLWCQASSLRRQFQIPCNISLLYSVFSLCFCVFLTFGPYSCEYVILWNLLLQEVFFYLSQQVLAYPLLEIIVVKLHLLWKIIRFSRAKIYFSLYKIWKSFIYDSTAPLIKRTIGLSLLNYACFESNIWSNMVEDFQYLRNL